MGRVRSTLLLLLFGGIQVSYCQQQSTNSLTDFVKQLTSFIGQNGGLGSLVNALPHGPYPPQQYPEYAPNYPGGSPGYRPPFRPDYPPTSGYPPYPGYRPTSDYPPYPGYPPTYGYPPASGYPPYPQQGLMSALASIARHDDLRCVPRLLCEVTSGGKPGYPSYSTGQQTVKDTITSLLTVLNFIDDNPLFIFGRAALLGAASRGNSATCLNAYPTCPRDPDQLVNYLNNHNGGFFRFFGGIPQETGRDKGQDEGKEESNNENKPADDETDKAEGEGRIQNRPLYSHPPAVRYPTRGPHAFNGPAEPQDYLTVSAHDDTSSPTDRFVFPSSADRGGRQLLFPEDRPLHSTASVIYKPDFSPPQNLINFRDQRSVKFPEHMNFPKS